MSSAMAGFSAAASRPLEVDLGYATYRGEYNEKTGLNTWLGIRYAEPPLGNLRWQRPVPPRTRSKGSEVVNANSYPKIEDCLFLNVYAPPNATNLPVFVWIHGGGYGTGDGTANIPFLISNSGYDFGGIAIQYRVQQYVRLFGGDHTTVTVAGESAGGGSVMLLAMACGGTLGISLFQNYSYSDFVPSQMYYTFAAAAGCFDGLQTQKSKMSVFDCLVAKDTATLQNASYTVSATGKYGQWAFLPVTDGDFVQQLPSQQFLKKQVNGARLLVGNNADEDSRFTPQNTETEADFVRYVRQLFPLFTESDSAARFATSGEGALTALNQSSFATAAGKCMQTSKPRPATNLYAEVTFVCPSYWMAEAFSDKNRASYKYQYSIIPAVHGYDIFSYFGPRPDTMSQAFQTSVMSIWNSFILTGTPTKIVNKTIPSDAATVIRSWPAFTVGQQTQLNLNQTGGHLMSEVDGVTGIKIPVYEGSGLKPDFALVDAYTWEGGRGQRCDFWRMMSARVPA
ncbi:putative carboxylesterase [Thermoascus aurantiacus ATCC 26904]